MTGCAWRFTGTAGSLDLSPLFTDEETDSRVAS